MNMRLADAYSLVCAENPSEMAPLSSSKDDRLMLQAELVHPSHMDKGEDSAWEHGRQLAFLICWCGSCLLCASKLLASACVNTQRA